MTTDQTASPLVCDLDKQAMDDQTLEWADLKPLAISTASVANGVVSTYPIDVAERLEDLANRENQCCGSWLQANTTRLSDVIRLEVTTTNPDGLAVIETMAGLRPSSERS